MIRRVICESVSDRGVVLGHGESVPGKHDDSRLSIWEQAEYTSRLIDSDFSSHRDIVLVARGWGVNVALELGKVTFTHDPSPSPFPPTFFRLGAFFASCEMIYW